MPRKLNNLTDAQKKDRSGSHPGEVDVARSSAHEYLRAIGATTKTSSSHEERSSERAEIEARMLLLQAEIDELRQQRDELLAILA